MAAPKTDYAEPDYARHQDKSKVPYYVSNLDNRISTEVGPIVSSMTTTGDAIHGLTAFQLKDLLETYSHVPRDQQSAHIHRVVSHRLWAFARLCLMSLSARPCLGDSPIPLHWLRRLAQASVESASNVSRNPHSSQRGCHHHRHWHLCWA